MKFRKKPVIIEAYQTDKEVYIETLEGTMRANPGDWIITGVNGEQFPCKPDIFEKTYELIECPECGSTQLYTSVAGKICCLKCVFGKYEEEQSK